MKKVLKQIGKAIGYFAVYLTCMNVVDLIAGFVWGYSKGKEFKEMGLSPDEAAAAFQSVETGYKGISMLIGAILTLLVFFIIEKVKKTSLAKETDMKMVTGKQMGLTVVGAFGGMFFMNFMLSILPIPEELLGDLTSGMGHPFDIYSEGSWRGWQKYLFDNKIVQPFKQVFRELYVKTEDEKGTFTSLRYAGNLAHRAKRSVRSRLR